MDIWSLAGRRVQRLEQQKARQRAEMDAWQWYHFLVAPSCPPDTSVQIRPGLALPAARYGLVQNQTYFEAQACEFTDTANTGLDCNFTNAGYYLGFILCYNSDWMMDTTTAQQFVIVGAASEHATAALAEEEIRLLLNGGDDWIYEVFPLWAMVLRNDGNTGIDGAILPVDAVNRERSYLFKDARQRNLLTK